MRTLILSGSDVESLMTPARAIVAVEEAFAQHGRGQTRMPSKVYLPLPEYQGDFRAMPVYADGAAGVKWINAHPHNPERHGLPAVIGVFILSDPDSAVPLAIMDATAMTAMRTGAGAAVATRHLARPDASSLGIVGCGVQARRVLDCHREVMRLDEVRLYDRTPEAAERLASERQDLPCRATELAEAAAADVVCTLTPSHDPILLRGQVRDGVHINAMGADAPGKEELEPAILADARVFLDDREQAMESGEVNVPLRDGRLAAGDIAGTLGEVVAGLAAGRADAKITVFDSTGLAVQDLALARIIYAEAREKSIGKEIELVS